MIYIIKQAALFAAVTVKWAISGRGIFQNA